MNSNVENKSYRLKDTSVNNIYLVMKKINETVSIGENLKRRTRNGGFIARPGTMYQQNLQESNKA